ncbi:DUF2971 domain-containing protein [Novosphingobium umbonatum]|nr:DUF2971 domain-containing protein [Novosphingobium umbonatum]
MPLAAAIDMIINNRICLLNPDGWPDKNDIGFISKFISLRNVEAVRAICFTYAAETYHHWSVYGQSDGVCVTFDFEKMIEFFQDEEFFWGFVEYYPNSKIRPEKLGPRDLCFTKRWAYKDEKEFRIMWSSSRPFDGPKYVNFEHNCISSIQFSPWTYDAICKSLKDIFLKCLKGGEGVRIEKSKITYHGEWLDILKSVDEMDFDFLFEGDQTYRDPFPKRKTSIRRSK